MGGRESREVAELLEDQLRRGEVLRRRHHHHHRRRRACHAGRPANFPGLFLNAIGAMAGEAHPRQVSGDARCVHDWSGSLFH